MGVQSVAVAVHLGRPLVRDPADISPGGRPARLRLHVVLLRGARVLGAREEQGEHGG